MADIIDYLKWRGDLPFSADPFNDVDNLILSELSYAKFDGIVPPDGRPVSISEARDGYFKLYPPAERTAKTAFSALVPYMLDEMANGARFGSAELSRYVNDLDNEAGEQFSAVTVSLSDGSVYAAFRGTDGSLVGWREDFEMGYKSGTAGQRAAARYLDAVAESTSGPIRTGGHSKGGNFAVYAAAFSKPETRRRISEIYSNDGPGFLDEVTESEGYREIAPRITSIIPESSAIGVLLTTAAERRVVKSAATGIMQHDGFSWQLERNSFIPAEQTEMSAFLGKTVKSWLFRLDEETRASAVETIFSVLESTGAESFRTMSEKKLKTAEAVAAAMRGVPREKQKELIRVMGDLFRSTGKVAAEYIKRD
ncbi:MAG: DUF2974 domain-containing protein [Oscillospiraceae bacterium]|nr:DUF2974 domain-containing protein [Oscillospiraceae bacterium]MBQ5503767.1 DUF2974 domain-containing protein [Oscillospiraceae bacterium]